MDVRGSRETILLVDDDPTILKVTARMLEAQGYVLLRASSPSEAILIADEHGTTIHLVLTDMMMPDMNGPDLAKALVSRRPQLKRLFMSGYGADVIGPQGVLDGRVSFVEKPFTRNELAAKVREVLDS